jgi:hypothetical protein
MNTDGGPGPADSGPNPLDSGAGREDIGPNPTPDGGPGGPCLHARRLWFDDFETGDYSRWTGRNYNESGVGPQCRGSGFSQDRAVSPSHSHKSEITCALPDNHRGYGGVQFAGDNPLPEFTNSGTGIDAPNGLVNTFHTWLDAPLPFGNGRWLSLMTANGTCNWNDRVVGVGLEDTGMLLTPSQIWSTGGRIDFANNAPAFPLRTWVRTTIYVNYYTGVMHVWQNGASVAHVNFQRPLRTICQWHWGSYAAPEIAALTLYEDDISLWKLNDPWTDFTVEPWFGHTQAVCSG